MEIFNEPQEVFVSEPHPFFSDSFEGFTSFSPEFLCPYLLIRDFLEKRHARISFSQKGEIILDINK